MEAWTDLGELDIRETDTLMSKCRSPDVNIVTHCLNAGILYAEESFLWSRYTVHLGDSGWRGREDREIDE